MIVYYDSIDLYSSVLIDEMKLMHVSLLSSYVHLGKEKDIILFSQGMWRFALISCFKNSSKF